METDVDITPGVAILGVLSHLNYEPWYALAEYVDNALQSAHVERDAIHEVEEDPHLAVNIEIDPAGPGRIIIEDNAGGIRIDDFPRAFRAAEIPPDRSGLSEFGMGMKSASIWFAQKWTVETSSVGDPHVYIVRFDMKDVLSGNHSKLAITTADADVNSHFTRITLTSLNQIPRGRTLGKIRDHMRDIYRTFLRSGELRLVVAGERLHYREPAILVAPDARSQGETAQEAVRWRKEIDIRLGDSLSAHGFAALREEGSTREAGFALFRRGRIIVGSGDAPYRPSVIYGRGNSYRSQRLFGELNIDGLPVSHTKDGFQWGEYEEQFLEALRAQLDSDPLPLLKQAENYRSRTVNRQQTRLILEATDSTARSIEHTLPSTLGDVVSAADVGTSYAVSDDALSVPAPDVTVVAANRIVEFDLHGQAWEVAVSSVQDSGSTKWLTRTIDRPSSGPVRVELALNAAHPFVRQFALGDRDSYEAVLRIAVALVVAESLTMDAGLEFVGTMMRHFDELITRALAGRVGSRNE